MADHKNKLTNGGGRALRPLAAVILTLGLVACASSFATRGHVTDEEDLATLTPGQTTLAEVQETLGSPSTTGTFNGRVWYYMMERTESLAFLKPKVVERQIVAIVFDESEVVADIVTYTEADGEEVQIVSRVTPTAGNELSLLQQLFGNIGRFQDR